VKDKDIDLENCLARTRPHSCAPTRRMQSQPSDGLFMADAVVPQEPSFDFRVACTVLLDQSKAPCFTCGRPYQQKALYLDPVLTRCSMSGVHNRSLWTGQG
jgi:hypothetical protein